MVKPGAAGAGGGLGGQGKPGVQGHPGAGGDNTPKNTRQFFDGEESCYIIDAKLEGNLGRYLNVNISAVPAESDAALLTAVVSLSLSLLCLTAQLQS